MSQSGYRLRCHLVAILVVGYVVGFSQGPKLGRPEFYPFFSWSLFSYTHSTRNEIAVLVHTLNGQPLEKPVSYYDLPKKFTNFPGGKIRMRKMLLDLIAAASKGDQMRQRELLKKYENVYFRNIGSVDYRLALINYNPIEKLNSGTYEISQIIYEGGYVSN